MSNTYRVIINFEGSTNLMYQGVSQTQVDYLQSLDYKQPLVSILNDEGEGRIINLTRVKIIEFIKE